MMAGNLSKEGIRIKNKNQEIVASLIEHGRLIKETIIPDPFCRMEELMV